MKNGSRKTATDAEHLIDAEQIVKVSFKMPVQGETIAER